MLNVKYFQIDLSPHLRFRFSLVTLRSAPACRRAARLPRRFLLGQAGGVLADHRVSRDDDFQAFDLVAQADDFLEFEVLDNLVYLWLHIIKVTLEAISIHAAQLFVESIQRNSTWKSLKFLY